MNRPAGATSNVIRGYSGRKWPAGLAQWLAHSLSKRKVWGSIPAAGTSLVIVQKPSMTQYDPNKGWPCR